MNLYGSSINKSITAKDILFRLIIKNIDKTQVFTQALTIFSIISFQLFGF